MNLEPPMLSEEWDGGIVGLLLLSLLPLFLALKHLDR